MMDFLKGLFIWAIRKILFFFFPALGWIVFFFENFGDAIKAAWSYFIDFFKWYMQDFYLWAFGELTSQLNSFFGDNSFIVDVTEFTNDVFLKINVFFPLNEFCACLSFLLLTITAVFLLRLALKAIPTIW